MKIEQAGFKMNQIKKILNTVFGTKSSMEACWK